MLSPANHSCCHWVSVQWQKSSDGCDDKIRKSDQCYQNHHKHSQTSMFQSEWVRKHLLVCDNEAVCDKIETRFIGGRVFV